MRDTRKQQDAEYPLTITIPVLNAAAQFLLSASTTIMKEQTSNNKQATDNIQLALAMLSQIGYRIQ